MWICRISPSTGIMSRSLLLSYCHHKLAFNSSQLLDYFIFFQCLNNIYLRLVSSPSRSSQRLVTATWRPKLWEVASSAFSLASSASPSCSPSSLMSAAYSPDSCRFFANLSVCLSFTESNLSVYLFIHQRTVIENTTLRWPGGATRSMHWSWQRGWESWERGRLKLINHFHILESLNSQTIFNFTFWKFKSQQSVSHFGKLKVTITFSFTKVKSTLLSQFQYSFSLEC